MAAGNNWQPRDPEVARLLDRVRALEARLTAAADHLERRRNRIWVLTLGILTPVVSTLIVTTILTWLHLRSLG
jgi:hypothetical protein